jgi:hypothetical protein
LRPCHLVAGGAGGLGAWSCSFGGCGLLWWLEVVVSFVGPLRVVFVSAVLCRWCSCPWVRVGVGGGGYCPCGGGGCSGWCDNGAGVPAAVREVK